MIKITMTTPFTPEDLKIIDAISKIQSAKQKLEPPSEHIEDKEPTRPGIDHHALIKELRPSEKATLIALKEYGELITTNQMSLLLDKTKSAIDNVVNRLMKKKLLYRCIAPTGFVGKAPYQYRLNKDGKEVVKWLNS